MRTIALPTSNAIPASDLAPASGLAAVSLLVREHPPLRTSYEIETPSGRRFRWGADEADAINIPGGARWSDTMPGGFEQLDLTLARSPDVDYADLERLSTIRIRDPGGGIAGEYRLERAPRVSGDQMAIAPSAAGWQACLSDDSSARMVYVDPDLSHWGSESVQMKLNDLNNGWDIDDPTTAPDPTAGQASLITKWTGAISRPRAAKAWYDAHGLAIGSLYYAWLRGTNVDTAQTHFNWSAVLSTDDVQTTLDATSNLRATGPGSGTLLASANDRKFAYVQFYSDAAYATDGDFSIFWTCLAVYGNHGLTKQGAGTATTPPGLLASDIATHAVRTWAPLLRITDDSVTPSSYVITRAAYLDPTTAAAIIKDVARYELPDWAVWENRTFYWQPRGAGGRSWRARVGPSQLQETGPQVDKLFNGVVVPYQDPDGSTRTVGPPGSGVNVEDATLLDTDPTSPANELGIRRWETLPSIGVGSAQEAIIVGQQELAANRLLNSSGQAKIVGYVEDDHGVTWPYHKVRAGDTITFTDAADPTPRRIVKTSKDQPSRTCTIDLDIPPDRLSAILARLSEGLAGVA